MFVKVRLNDDFVRKHHFPAPGFEAAIDPLASSCQVITFLTGIYISPIEHSAPIDCQYSRGPCMVKCQETGTCLETVIYHAVVIAPLSTYYAKTQVRHIFPYPCLKIRAGS